LNKENSSIIEDIYQVAIIITAVYIETLNPSELYVSESMSLLVHTINKTHCLISSLTVPFVESLNAAA